MKRTNSHLKVLLLLVFVGLITGCSSDDSDQAPDEPAPTNTAPSIADPGPLSVTEGTAAVATISASDADGDTVTLSISGGADASLFTLEDDALSFSAAADFEAPGDADGDNTYLLEISASDGTDTASLLLEISVADAFEGRVIDGPVAGALVFVDLNCNNEQDEGEPAGETDAEGFFKVEKAEASEGCAPKIISIGGTDTATGKALANLALIADLPTDGTKAVAVTPLTTVVAAAETAEEKAQVLSALGLGANDLETILTTDSWAGSEGDDATSIAIQRVNAQIAVVLQAAVEASADEESAATASVLTISAAAVSLVSAAKQAVAGGSDTAPGILDLTSASVVTDALSAAAAASGKTIAEETISAIAVSVTSLTLTLANEDLNPTAALAITLASRAQEVVLVQVALVVAGTIDVSEFETATAATEVFKDIDAGEGALDTDGDGLADTIDTDDDGDGVLDDDDGFKLIPLDGRTDTDRDGIPNNCDAACLATGMTADTDDDGDGVLDEKDAFPLISLAGRTDTDGDGFPNDCDTACLATGLIADLDDDNDGVLDAVDGFPLISLGSLIDTDGDGRPNDCDAGCLALGMIADEDDDNDSLKDSNELALGTNPLLADTDGDGILDASDPFPTFAGSQGFDLPTTITVLATEE